MGTAEKHLRKSIIHELAKQLGKNTCCRCGLEILSSDDLAVVHVQEWEDDPDLYWALTNVAFSHASCEAARSGKRQREKKQMSKVEVRVLDPRGKALPGTRHEGQLYVAGKKGSQYQIRVRNKGSKNVMVVVTVDGRNIITGEPGDYHGSGHVIGPKSSWTFKGWRTSDDEVAAFEFGKKKDAYSTEMGSPENVGVIGVAVFEELEPDPVIKTVKEYVPMPYPVYPQPTYPYPRRDIWWTTIGTGVEPNGNVLFGGVQAGGSEVFAARGVTYSTCSNTVTSSGLSVKLDSHIAQEGQKQQRLGTGWGEQLSSPVRSVSFQKATEEPCEVHTIRYDSLGALRERGIMVRPSEKRQEVPQAFPESPRYCPPPKRKAAYK